MKRYQIRIYLSLFLILGITSYSQTKKKFSSLEGVLTRIIPNEKLDYWALVHNSYGKDREVVSSGTKKEFISQFSGFNLSPAEDSFYYIVYSNSGKLNYITDIKDLKGFIGKIENPEEAALSAVMDGYMIDEQFVDVAANYYQDKTNYYLDLGKVTSKECPYQKNHFTLTVNKSTGIISEAKDNGSYIELYTKKCPNNPRLLKIEKKEEPQDEPKKQPVKKRR